MCSQFQDLLHVTCGLSYGVSKAVTVGEKEKRTKLLFARLPFPFDPRPRSNGVFEHSCDVPEETPLFAFLQREDRQNGHRDTTDMESQRQPVYHENNQKRRDFWR